MAQEAPTIQNKWLLVVAGLLALIVTTIYNVHLHMVRTSLEGKTITLLRVTRDMKAGDRIKPADVERFNVPRDFAGSLENVVPGDDKNYNWVMDQTLSLDISKGQNLTWAHLTEGDTRTRPSSRITPGMTTFQIQISPNDSPGEQVRVGDHINIYGMFIVGNKPLNTYLVMHGATVLAVEGRASREKVIGAERRTVTEEDFPSFRKISIEVSPDVFIKMKNLQSHLAEGGAFSIGALNPLDTDFPQTPPGPDINKELTPLTASAAPFARAAAGGN